MSPEFLQKWEHILRDVDKNKIPVQFIRKLVVKLSGKRQHTINIKKLIGQGLESDHIEGVINNNLSDLEDQIVSVEFVLDVETIADTVQPATDDLLKNL